jgi:hypothetical protein
MQDKLAAAQLDLDKRDREIDELNAELDARLREHEQEIGQVAAEWKDEVLEARAQVDELRDVSAAFRFAGPTWLMSGARDPRT